MSSAAAPSTPGSDLPPDIAVVIPAWNAEAYLEATVATVLSQSYQAFELIIVDDGSTDTTAQIADRLAMDGRVRVIHQQPNVGLSAARNVGAGAIAPSVEFVLFLDSDDLLEPDALRRLRECLMHHPECNGAYGLPLTADAAGVPRVTPMERAFGWDRLEVAGWRVRRVAADRPTTFDCMTIWCCIETSGQVLLRRSALSAAGPWTTMPGEDWEMWLRLTALAPFARVPRVVLLKRAVSGSLSSDGKWLARAEPMIRRNLTRPPYTPAQRRVATIAHAYSCLVKAQWGAREFKQRRFASAMRHERRAVLAAGRFCALQVERRLRSSQG